MTANEQAAHAFAALDSGDAMLERAAAKCYTVARLEAKARARASIVKLRGGGTNLSRSQLRTVTVELVVVTLHKKIAANVRVGRREVRHNRDFTTVAHHRVRVPRKVR